MTLLFPLLLLGCLTRDAFVRQDADLFCAYVSECEVKIELGSCDGPGRVYSYDECVDAVHANADAYYAGCEYDPESAEECLRAYQEDRDPGECPDGGFFSMACFQTFDCENWPYLTCDE